MRRIRVNNPFVEHPARNGDHFLALLQDRLIGLALLRRVDIGKDPQPVSAALGDDHLTARRYDRYLIRAFVRLYVKVCPAHQSRFCSVLRRLFLRHLLLARQAGRGTKKQYKAERNSVSHHDGKTVFRHQTSRCSIRHDRSRFGQNCSQHLRLDVAAAHHHDRLAIRQQLDLMKEHSRRRYRAARFGTEPSRVN